MKLSEIVLVEKISLSQKSGQILNRIEETLNKELTQYYQDNVKKMPFWIHTKDEDAFISPESRQEGVKQVTEFIEEMLYGIFHDETTNILRNFPGADMRRTRVFTYFKEFKGNDGSFSPGEHPRININRKYLIELGENAYYDLQETFYNSGHDTRAYIQLDASVLVEKIVDIFLHELTHAIQFTREGDKGHAYRSYVEKNKQRFWQIVSKETDKTLEDDKVYLGSPQEIEAFAQEEVGRLVRDARHTQWMTIDDQINYLEETRKYVSGKYSRYMSLSDRDKNTRVEQKVYNRFLKKIYQAIDSHIDDLKKTKAHQDAYLKSISPRAKV